VVNGVPGVRTPDGAAATPDDAPPTAGAAGTVTLEGWADSPSLETRNNFATLRSKRISDFVSGGGTADHLTGSPLTN